MAYNHFSSVLFFEWHLFLFTLYIHIYKCFQIKYYLIFCTSNEKYLYFKVLFFNFRICTFLPVKGNQMGTQELAIDSPTTPSQLGCFALLINCFLVVVIVVVVGARNKAAAKNSYDTAMPQQTLQEIHAYVCMHADEYWHPAERTDSLARPKAWDVSGIKRGNVCNWLP